MPFTRRIGVTKNRMAIGERMMSKVEKSDKDGNIVNAAKKTILEYLFVPTASEDTLEYIKS